MATADILVTAMKKIGQSNTVSRKAYRLTWLVASILLWAAGGGDPASAGTSSDNQATAIRIVDRYGRQIASGKRDVGSQIFDVIVGPVGSEFTFKPDTANIRVGDTVRWTWASDFHSVTSGTK